MKEFGVGIESPVGQESRQKLYVKDVHTFHGAYNQSKDSCESACTI